MIEAAGLRGSAEQCQPILKDGATPSDHRAGGFGFARALPFRLGAGGGAGWSCAYTGFGASSAKGAAYVSAGAPATSYGPTSALLGPTWIDCGR